jgi:excisionase family DNA binding protein
MKTLEETPVISSRPLLKFPFVAEFLGISLRHFRRKVDAGEIAYVELGDGTVRIRQEDLDQYISKHRKQHPATAA